MRIFYIIVRKELVASLRNKKVIFTSAIFGVLLLTSGMGSYVHYTFQKEQIEAAQLESRNQWLEQGNKHPHIAAHFGTFVFKPKTALSFFDVGLDAYTGSSIYLEAHYQHEFMFRPAQDMGAMIRFGELSMAVVLQLLVPLVIVFLTFSSFAQERENGTLNIVLSQGISLPQLAWGKIAAYCMLLLGILLPIMLLLLAGLYFRTAFSLTEDIFCRIMLLGLTYFLYFYIFTGFGVWMSFHAASSKNALLSLLTAWMVFIVVAPKAAASIASALYPLPSLSEYQQQIKEDINSRIERNVKKDTLILHFTKKLLKQYRVASVSQLPINYEAACAQVYEDFGNKIHDKHSVLLYHQMIRQNKVSSFISTMNPYMAIRNLSMSLSATDFYTYAHFQSQAENYRRALVKKMNMDYRDHSKTGEFYEYKAGKKLWESIPDFHYAVPTLRQSPFHYFPELTALLLWATGIAMIVTCALPPHKI